MMLTAADLKLKLVTKKIMVLCLHLLPLRPFARIHRTWITITNQSRRSIWRHLLIALRGALYPADVNRIEFCPNPPWVQQSSNRVWPKPDKPSVFYVQTWPESDAINVNWSTEFVLLSRNCCYHGYSVPVYPDYTCGHLVNNHQKA